MKRRRLNSVGDIGIITVLLEEEFRGYSTSNDGCANGRAG